MKKCIRSSLGTSSRDIKQRLEERFENKKKKCLLNCEISSSAIYCSINPYVLDILHIKSFSSIAQYNFLLGKNVM